ncbi:hypothetical protein [Desulfobotulus mexicanus]|uniref:Uncharacterized protein n=1 Tax=Desulfobotulus mexicanus TaxID=2586642 RepID=A0A5Q4VHA5_9BACT|nr:hypothetical protein [Desulfobotulus mexicanus]TYT75662.1 hypothetical protein FIM25_04285 [Desulfobotulus mexicanus]
MQPLRIVSRELEIPLPTLHSWIRSGRISSEKSPGGERLVSADEVRKLPRFLRRSAQPPIPDEDAADIREAMRLTGWHSTTINKKAVRNEIRSCITFRGGRLFSRQQLLEIQKAQGRARERAKILHRGRKKCTCCGRQPVAPGLRMLCRSCYLRGDARGDV